MTDITREEIAELRRLCAEATPGPWTAFHKGECPCGYVFGADGEAYIFKGLTLEDDVDPVTTPEGRKANIAFVLAAREWLPNLLDYVQKLERTIGEMVSDRLASDARGWRQISEAPKDGRWIIAMSNDRSTLYRVSWGRSRDGEMWWCSEERSYGDGLFCGWIPFPDFPAPDADEENKT